MPTIPKLVADVFTPLYKQSTVTRVQLLHPRLKKITAQGKDLKGLHCTAGAQVEPRAGDTAFRHYNPSAFDSTTGTFEMLIYLHDKGPGSKWAAELKQGDPIYMLGPANKIALDISYRKIVFLGDETAIGTFLFMQNSLGPLQRFDGAIEAEADMKDIASTIGVNLKTVVRTATHGATLLNWLQQNLENNRKAHFYILGNVNTNKTLKNYLKENGISSTQITTKKYWAEGKIGL